MLLLGCVVIAVVCLLFILCVFYRFKCVVDVLWFQCCEVCFVDVRLSLFLFMCSL